MRAEAVATGDHVTRQLVVQLQPKGWRHPALFGMDVLGSHRCTFQFDHPRIDLDAPEPPNAAWFSLPTDPGHPPIVQVRWGKTTSTAVWDTGAGATLVDQSWAGEHPDLVTVSDGTGRATDVTGAERDHGWGRLAACRIGDIGFAEQSCAVVDLSALNAALGSPIEVVLGLPLIVEATWCMDFPGRRWSCSPA